MTTIAFDGEHIAADSMLSGAYVDTAEKIFKISGGYLMMAGSYSEGLIFKKWCKDRTKPKPKLDDFEALEIRGKKVMYYDEGIEPIPLKAPAAIGTGCQFAMGAMLAGATAKEAVKIASKLDEATGGRIKVVKVR